MEGYNDCQIPCVQLRHIYSTLSIICFDIIYLHMHYTRVHNPDMCTHIIYTLYIQYTHTYIYIYTGRMDKLNPKTFQGPGSQAGNQLFAALVF